MAGSGLFGNQSPIKKHLVRGTGGVQAEIRDVREDIGTVLAPMCALTVEEFTDPPAADIDAIKTSIASSAAQQVYSGTALNGVVGRNTMSPPRNITVTASSHADIDAVGVLVEGKDVNGRTISETLTLPNGGGSTVLGQKAFASVSRITVPAQSGTGGLLSFGFGDLIGLGKKIVSRAGALAVLMEIEAGVVMAADAITGVFADPAVGEPNGTYLPATVPSGANDYAVYYEYDPTA
jgi:hypothetical protein